MQPRPVFLYCCCDMRSRHHTYEVITLYKTPASCGIPGTIGITGSHSNQDPPYTLKPIYTPIYTHYIRSWLLCPPVIGCSRYIPNYYYVGLSANINVMAKTTNSQTQGQPNTRKNRLEWQLGHFFPHSKYFFVGWDWFKIGNRLQET